MLAGIRAFFAARGVLEVDTPLLSRAAATDLHVHSASVELNAERRYLHTSPEFPMKRLLAAGSGDIFQVCKVVRADEAGRWHNPEFTMLEWYRLGFDQHDLMNEVVALLETLDEGPARIEKLSYGEAFRRHVSVDPHRATVAELADAATDRGLDVTGRLDRDAWLDLLMSAVVAPAFAADAYTFVYDYPASQAALARTHRVDDVEVAARFELFRGELELANGFHELSDADEQRRRFEADLQARQSSGLELPPMDRYLLEALASGLPECSGVALGIDRLLAVLQGGEALDTVLTFPWERA